LKEVLSGLVKKSSTWEKEVAKDMGGGTKRDHAPLEYENGFSRKHCKAKRHHAKSLSRGKTRRKGKISKENILLAKATVHA